MGYAQPFEVDLGRPLTRPVDSAGSADKLLGLELLRFASALAVLFFHYRHFGQLAGMAVARTDVPLYSLLWPLYDYGQFGVQVFWGISGYIFFWKYGPAIHSGAVAARDFFWLRFSRLYPLHIVTLAAVVGLQAVHRELAGFDYVYPAQDAGQLVRQLFLATDWGPLAPFSFNGPVWSISAEVAVYAGFFLLLRKFAPTSRLCIGVIVAGLLAQLAGLEWASIGCATYFFAGGLATLAPARSKRPAALGLIALIAACAIAGVLGDRDKLPVILLIAVPSLMVVAARDWPLPNRWARSIQSAGNLTYSSYLLHFPLQLILAITVTATGWQPPLADGWFLAAYLGLVLITSAASYRWFELPAQRWLRRRTLRRG